MLMTSTPHPFVLPRESCALVVVDYQEKLARTLDDEVRADTVRGVQILMRAADRLGIPVLITEQYPAGLGATLPELAELAPEAPRFEKVAFDCCGADGFVDRLGELGADHIVLVGMETHICVLQTALSLAQAGRRVWVARDAVCSRQRANWEAGLALMERAGAVVAPVETLLFMWLGRSGTPEFKELSALIK